MPIDCECRGLPAFQRSPCGRPLFYEAIKFTSVWLASIQVGEVQLPASSVSLEFQVFKIKKLERIRSGHAARRTVSENKILDFQK